MTSWKNNRGSGENVLVTGNHNFQLDVSVKGQSTHQNTSISLNAFAKNDKRIAVPIQCRWYRVRGQRSVQLFSVSSNTYQCSALDYLSVIKAEVTSMDEECGGLAIVQFGPIKLDLAVKSNLESALAQTNQNYTFEVHISPVAQGRSVSEEEVNCVLNLREEHLLFSRVAGVASTTNQDKPAAAKLPFSLDQPAVEVSHQDTCRLNLVYQAQYATEFKKIAAVPSLQQQYKSGEARVSLRFKTRNDRDLFLLLLKSQAAKSYLLTRQIVSRLDSVLWGQGARLFSGTTENGSGELQREKLVGDLFLEVDGLKKDLQAATELSGQLQHDKEQQAVEIRRLEEELQSTIETYTQILRDSQNEAAAGRPTHNQQRQAEEVAQRHERTLLEKNRTLERRLVELENIAAAAVAKDNLVDESRFMFKSHDLSEWLSNNQSNIFVGGQGGYTATKQQQNTHFQEEIRHLKTINEQLKEQLAITENQLRQARLDLKLATDEEKRLREQNAQLKNVTAVFTSPRASDGKINILQQQSSPSTLHLQVKVPQSSLQPTNLKTHFENAFQSPQREVIFVTTNQSPSTDRGQSFGVLVGSGVATATTTAGGGGPTNTRPAQRNSHSQNNSDSSGVLEHLQQESVRLQNKIALLQKQNEALQTENELLKTQSVMFSQNGEDAQYLKALEERIQDTKRMNERLLEDIKKLKKRNDELERLAGTLQRLDMASAQKMSNEEGKRLQEENESLLQQRNQLVKKVESLQRELEQALESAHNNSSLQKNSFSQGSKPPSVSGTGKLQITDLIQTNQRLITENKQVCCCCVPANNSSLNIQKKHHFCAKMCIVGQKFCIFCFFKSLKTHTHTQTHSYKKK